VWGELTLDDDIVDSFREASELDIRRAEVFYGWRYIVSSLFRLQNSRHRQAGENGEGDHMMGVMIYTQTANSIVNRPLLPKEIPPPIAKPIQGIIIKWTLQRPSRMTHHAANSPLWSCEAQQFFPD
jgi:hypothetical protein